MSATIARARGYLLIEVLVALAIAASSLSALVSLQLHLARDSRLAAERNIAAVHAESAGEALLTGIHAGDAQTGAEDELEATAPDGSAAGFHYYRQVTLASHPALIDASITVAWPAPDAGPPTRIAFMLSAQPSASVDSGQAGAGTPAFPLP